MYPISYKLHGKGKVKISQSPLDMMLAYRQNNFADKEAGGMLFGRFLLDSNNIIIDDLTVPMVGDIRKRYSFHRAQTKHQQVLDHIWEESRGTCHYLGEWHTHPELDPSPSKVDLNDWKRIMNKTKTEANTFLFIIVGIEKIRIWHGLKDTMKIVLLSESEEE